MNSVPGLVLVVEDDAGLRAALEGLFQSVGLEVRLFSSASEFREGSLPEKPCCLILDVRLPGQSGLELQDELIRSETRPPIIFVTGHGDVPMTVRAMKAGAVEFLQKPFRDQELLDAVHMALQLDHARRASADAVTDLRRRLASLTVREREVFGHVVAGRPNKHIAIEMGVSEITVKVHRGHMIKKMAAGSVADLVRMAAKLETTSVA